MLRNFLKRLFSKSKTNQKTEALVGSITVDKSKLAGNDFEFLIVPSDIEIKNEDFDRIMTPDSLQWTKIIKDDWAYYQVDTDEFSYSWEEPGIQMTFNKEISYNKAKLIADEVVTKLSKYTGQELELIFIPKDKVISFQ